MLAMDPNSTYKVVLNNYKAMDKDKQPVFVLRYLSARLWKVVSAISDDLDRANGGEDSLAIALSAIKPNLIGWENVKDAKGEAIEFDVELLEDVLLATEMIELMRWVINQTPSFDDKKKSDLP